MPVLYVENVPQNLYDALRARARGRRRSIAAEVLALLDENIPTENELARRREFVKRLQRLRARKSPARGAFPSTEEMLREDRSR